MKIILLKSVPNLGQAGEAKEVKAGYARNYLIPHKFAIFAADPKAKEIVAELKRARIEQAQTKKILADRARTLVDKEVRIEARGTIDGKLYAAITAKQIAKLLGLPEKSINFSPVKSAGIHRASIELGGGVKTEVSVRVVLEPVP
ncbi:50S ribosomal protein L9 [Candidatus Berkelbacteria bacterium]|nr:50S ribosomal protein L9 [Candidatus Berkelbacteria bacterium]